MSFEIGNPQKARIVNNPPVATTNASGEARVTLEGIAKTGNTTVKATATSGESGWTEVKVPDLSVIGLAMLLALVLGVEVRRRRAASAGR